MPNGALIAHYQMPRDLCKLWPGVSHRGHGGRKGTDLKSVIAVMGLVRAIWQYGKRDSKNVTI
jgi:hypothetical protein